MALDGLYIQDDWQRAGTKFVWILFLLSLLYANAKKLALYTLSQICQEVKSVVGAVMTWVYPIRIRNTESDRTENCALFTSPSDGAQGYKFFC